jgi:hypothetical protein
MSDQPQDPGFPSPADYQAATAGQGVPYAAAAAQAAGQVVDPEAIGEGADAGPVIERIRQQVTRDVLLPMETKIQAMMDAAQAQQDQLRGQIEALQGQLQATRAQVGPPAATLYATSVAQRVRSVAAANPDLGQAHFAPAVAAADKLAAVSADVTAGKAEVSDLAAAAAPVQQWFTTRRGRFVEGADTVLAELGHLAEETAKLAAAA